MAQVKTQPSLSFVISLNEEEAREVRACLSLVPRGLLPVTDDLYDKLEDAGYVDEEQFEPVMKAVKEAL